MEKEIQKLKEIYDIDVIKPFDETLKKSLERDESFIKKKIEKKKEYHEGSMNIDPQKLDAIFDVLYGFIANAQTEEQIDEMHDDMLNLLYEVRAKRINEITPEE